jgi:FtsH-binding integral membrane protein
MNCHDDNKQNQKSHQHSPTKHMWHMILCCALPIVVIGILPFVARFSPSASGLLGRIAPFLCPLMMLAMLPMMFGGNKKASCCDDRTQNDNKPLELNKPAE